MPLRQYFIWVGSLLLLGLFAADWCLPAPAVHARSSMAPQERVNLRIRSDQKWPERVVFETQDSRLASTANASAVSEPGQDRGQVKQLTLLFLQTLNKAWEQAQATNWKTHRS